MGRAYTGSVSYTHLDVYKRQEDDVDEEKEETSRLLEEKTYTFEPDEKKFIVNDNGETVANFYKMCIRDSNKRRYIKVSTKNKAIGSYTLHLKKRFAIPEVNGMKGQDKYTLTWNSIENAKKKEL